VTRESIEEYAQAIRARYFKARKTERSKLLASTSAIMR
jgi:hypothetical protein